MKKDYGRTVTLQCPNCQSTNLSIATDTGGGNDMATCAGCGLQIARAKLIEANQAVIQGQVGKMKDEIVKDVRDDIRRTLGKAFKS